MKRMLLTFYCCCACAAALAQQSDSKPGVERLETVEVIVSRDKAVMPYAGLNQLLRGFAQYGEGLFKADFRLISNSSGKRMQATKVAVLTAERLISIDLDADGRIKLPVLTTEEAKDADLATDLPKGSLRIEADIALTYGPEQLDMAMVRRTVAAARKMRSDLLPWYVRWIFPPIEAVRICSSQPNWELEWPDRGQLLAVPLTANPGDKDTIASAQEPARVCTSLSGEERWPDAARLVAPADTSLSVRLLRRP